MTKYKNFVGVDNSYVPAASMDRDTIFVPRPNGVSPFAPCVSTNNWAKGFASFVGDNTAPNEFFAPTFKLADVYIPVQPSPPVNMNAYDSHFNFNGRNVVGADIQAAVGGLAPAVNQTPISIAVPSQGANPPAFGNSMDWSQANTSMPSLTGAASSAPTPDAIPNNLNAAAKPTHLLPIIIGLGIIGFFYFKNK